MQPAGAFVVGLRRYTPKASVGYEVPAIDVIHVKEGLVSAKYTYLDTDTIQTNSTSVVEICKR
jgi:hypothetical protein